MTTNANSTIAPDFEEGDTGTIYLPPYDPTVPVDRSNQIGQLAAICILNGLTLIIIVARTWYRGKKLKRFRADDKWIIAAGVLLVFPLFTCQIGTNMYGSGLHSINIKPEWQEPHWIFSWGWSAAYIVSALIRVSVCSCLLDIVPHSFTKLRRSVYCLCALILSMGLILALIWIFQYRPFLANFDYNTPASVWIDVDPPRYLWCAMNVPIDLGIIAIPYIIIKKTKLQTHERRIIFMVFAAQALGTIASIFGIWGVWLNREAEIAEIYWNESIWLILTDIEIFMYTLGATFPMFSRYFILKAAPSPSQQNSSQRTWFKGIAHTISSRFTPRTRTYFSRSGRSYDEISIGLSSAKQPRTESLEKLDAVPLGQVSEKAINSDPEQGKTMWVSANSVSRADSVDSRV